MNKGFVMDDARLKNPDGRPDHFDEMLAGLLHWQGAKVRKEDILVAKIT